MLDHVYKYHITSIANKTHSDYNAVFVPLNIDINCLTCDFVNVIENIYSINKKTSFMKQKNEFSHPHMHALILLSFLRLIYFNSIGNYV